METNKRFYIYKITLLKGSLAGKYYYGKRHLKKGINNPMADGYYGSGTIVKQYYKKYPFEHGITAIKEILEFNSTEEKNREREIFYIGDKYENDPNCLNLKGGGFGGTLSEESRKKESESKKGCTAWNKGLTMSDDYRMVCRNRQKGKKWTDEQRAKFIESNTGHVCSNDVKKKISEANTGKKRTEDEKKKLSDAHKGIKYARAKQVIQYDIEGNFIKEWHSSSVIEKETGYNHSNILNCCNGKSPQAYGYIWKYAA